jgi:hypothetical protein
MTSRLPSSIAMGHAGAVLRLPDGTLEGTQDTCADRAAAG